MSVFSARAMQDAKDSPKIYQGFRHKPQSIVSKLSADGITKVYLDVGDEIIDSLRLIRIEAGLLITDERNDVGLGPNR